VSTLVTLAFDKNMGNYLYCRRPKTFVVLQDRHVSKRHERNFVKLHYTRLFETGNFNLFYRSFPRYHADFLQDVSVACYADALSKL